MFKKITEFFIPPNKLEVDNELKSERIFVAVLLISALSNFLGINLAIEIGAKLNGQLLLLNGIINLLILIAYRFGVPKFTAASIFLTQYAISFPLQAWLQGGLLSPASAAFFLLPSVAMLILGKRPAIFWMIISALLSISLLLLELYQGAPTPEYNIDKKQIFYFSSILGTNLTIFLILLVYELGKSSAMQNLREKHKVLINTQAQLIQQEKMASLGELTAGIAHEIQNPLNFVNNFSEINKELFEELKEVLGTGDIDEIKLIVSDIEVNDSKINEHGKRAESIVKGMLAHSRGNSGEKVLTDLNALVDECVRLAYHGLRAKDKTFNAEYILDLDSSLPKVNVIASDVGRVLLNLMNNAFYASAERSRSNAKSKEEESDPMPLVIVSTKNINQRVEFRVRDNGNGIPDSIKEKIFQPFFTTKPTGSGTGLGLSLSYDIVKAHGGEISVQSREGNGTELIVTLPI